MAALRYLACSAAFAGVLFSGISSPLAAQDDPEIRFENHQFKPQTLTVPAGRKLTIRVVIASDETIEFESFKLNREEILSPGETTTVHLPALSDGTYDFYDDFHQDVPEGSIVAK